MIAVVTFARHALAIVGLIVIGIALSAVCAQRDVDELLEDLRA